MSAEPIEPALVPPRRPLSLRLRIALSVAVAIVLTLAVTTLAIDSLVDTEVAQRADANLLERAQALSDMVRYQRDGNRTEFPPGSMPQFLADDGIVYFSINCAGHPVAASHDAEHLAWPSVDPKQPVYADLSDPRGTELRAIVMPFTAQPGLSWGAELGARQTAMLAAGLSPPACRLGLAVDHSEVANFQHTMDAIFVGSILLAIAVVVVLVPVLVARGLRPLARLAEEMRGIGPATPERRLAATGAYELRPLTERFNEVLARMQDGLQRERQFASGVAHELRTPLAELRTLVEVELRYPGGREPRALLADIGAIGAEMERLVGALLLLTRIEAGIEPAQRQSVDLTRLTRKLLERSAADAAARQLVLEAPTGDTVIWTADPALIEVLLGNLLGNAIAYAPTGSRIVLQCSGSDWSIRNEAPRLVPADLALMQRRFWRQGEDAGVHTGLGLALATAAAEAQGLRLALSLHDGWLLACVSHGGTAGDSAN